jgi:predicted secreted protein
MKTTCAHCGKKRAEMKRCSTCKHASYCGAACQKAGWKQHKKTCKTLNEVSGEVRVAREASDWRGVLKWEGRMEELVEAQTDDKGRDAVLSSFMRAHMMLDEGEERVLQIESRRVDLLGKMERFRDQGRALCHLGHCHNTQGREDEAARCFQRGRDLGAAHGFFSLECKACEGLGILAMKEGRHQEGVDLLRNALAGPSTLYPLPSTLYPLPSTLGLPSTLNPHPCNPSPLNPLPAAPLNEYNDISYELTIFRSLIVALFTAAAASYATRWRR